MDPSWAIPQSLVRLAILVEEVVLGAKLLGRGAKLPAVRFSKKNLVWQIRWIIPWPKYVQMIITGCMGQTYIYIIYTNKYIYIYLIYILLILQTIYILLILQTNPTVMDRFFKSLPFIYQWFWPEIRQQKTSTIGHSMTMWKYPITKPSQLRFAWTLRWVGKMLKLLGGWTEKYSSKWESSPNKGENNKRYPPWN